MYDTILFLLKAALEYVFLKKKSEVNVQVVCFDAVEVNTIFDKFIGKYFNTPFKLPETKVINN